MVCAERKTIIAYNNCVEPRPFVPRARPAHARKTHSHGHAIVQQDPERRISGERWYEYGFELLQRCDRLWVLELTGWRESHGVQREIAIATSRGIPLEGIDPLSLGIDSHLI